MGRSGSDIAGLREQIKDNATVLLSERRLETANWVDGHVDFYRIVVVGEHRNYTAIIKCDDPNEARDNIRIQAPKATTIRKALKKLLKHTANQLAWVSTYWDDKSRYTDTDKLVEADDGARYVKSAFDHME